MKTKRSTSFWWLTGIVLLGLCLRLYRLGALGLAGNEDYLAIAVRAVLESGVPEFPSGIVYPRALPLTYLTAALVAVLGAGEAVLRLPGVVFSTLAIVGAFLLTRRLVSTRTALLAALLMAISDWEIQVARTARMYSMLSAGCVFSVWLLDRALERRQWQPGVAAALTTALTTWIHQLAMALGVMFACLPLFFGLDRRRVKILAAGLLALALGAGSYYLLNRHQYAQWDVVVESVRGAAWEEAPDARGDFLEEFSARYLGPWNSLAASHRGSFLALAALAAGLVAGAGIASLRRPRELPFFGALALLSVALPFQQLSLAALVLGAYVLLGRRLQPGVYVSRALVLAALFGAAAASWLLYSARTTLAEAAPDSSVPLIVKSIVKPLVAYPPNFFKIYVELYPVMSVLVACACLVAAARYLRDGELDRLGLLALFFVAPILFLGLHPQSIGRTVERYVSFLNPFFLMLVAAGAGWIAGRIHQRLGRRPLLRRAALGAFVIVLLLLTGFANLRASLACISIEYGLNPDFRDRKTLGNYFHPDLAGVARFVDSQRGEDDLVIAMDVLGHYAYSRHVDYQLTLYGKPDAEGWLGARSISSRPELAALLERQVDRRVWIALAATHLRWFEDDPRLAEILELIVERAGEPLYRGRDGLSDVYLVSPAGGS